MNWQPILKSIRRKYISLYGTYAQQNTNDYIKLETELVNLMNATKEALEQGEYQAVLEMEKWLWSSGGRFFDLQSHTRDGIDLINQAIAAAHFLGNLFQEGRLLGQLGRVWLSLDNLPTATEYFKQALKIAHEINDLKGVSSHLGCLGQISLEQGIIQKKASLFQEAASLFQEALKFSKEIGDEQLEGRHIASLGLLMLAHYSTISGLYEAIQYFKKAIAIARKIGDRQGEASHLGCLGNAFEFLVRIQSKSSLSAQPFVQPFQWGSPYPGEDFERYERHQKKSNHFDSKMYSKAIEHYEQALAIACDIGDRQLQERLKRDLARVVS